VFLKKTAVPFGGEGGSLTQLLVTDLLQHPRVQVPGRPVYGILTSGGIEGEEE